MALLVLLVTASTARCIGLWFASEDSGRSQQTIGMLGVDMVVVLLSSTCSKDIENVI